MQDFYSPRDALEDPRNTSSRSSKGPDLGIFFPSALPLHLSPWLGRHSTAVQGRLTLGESVLQNLIYKMQQRRLTTL